MTAPVAFALFLLATPAPAHRESVVRPRPYPDGAALIRAMHDRYAGKWYHTLSFVQTTTLSRPTPHQETWYEAARIPGNLRIDISPVDSENMILFRHDTLYRFKQGQLAGSRPFVHPLMVLGFDVYLDAPDTTIGKLKALGFAMDRIREAAWQGRPVYVVGAGEGDTTSAQFWIDKERLLFVRMLEPVGDKPGTIAETQFNRYQPLGQGWISVEVVFTVNGEQITKEEYAEVRGDPELPADLFDATAYKAPGWVGGGGK